MQKNIIKILSAVTVAFGLLLASPVSYVFAASGDVVITQQVSYTVTSGTSEIEVIFNGNPAPSQILIQQVTVNAGNIVLSRVIGDTSILITSPTRWTFTITGITDPGTTCNQSVSTLTIPAAGASAETVTITPNAPCTTGGGGGGGGGGGTPAPTPPPPADTTTTTTGTVTATPSTGGTTTLTTTAGTTATVTVSANTVSANTSVTVATQATSSILPSRPAPVGKSSAGSNVFDLTATAGGSSVTTFSKAVTLAFTYKDADIAGLNENSLKVYWWNASTQTWTLLASVVDPVTNKVTATTDHFSYFAIFGDQQTTTPVSLVDTKGVALKDGDLIKTSDSFDIYIASFVGTKKFKRLILNPDIFNSYGHLSWSKVKTVSQTVQDAFTLSDLVMEVYADGKTVNGKVYKVSSAPNSDVGQKQWINMTPAQFEAKGYQWDAIAKINHTEAGANFYPEGAALTN